MDGELSNRVPGKVTGWMRFFRRRRQPLRVVFDFAGDFHEDIRGSDVVLKNDYPVERDNSFGKYRTYMEGFDPVQRGKVGDMTAGLPLGPWTAELAQRLKAQLEIVWRENGRTGTELNDRRRMLPRSTPRTLLRANSTIRTSTIPTSNGIPTTAGSCWSSIRPRSGLSDRNHLPRRRARKR
jgi:hypothetical protein